MPVMSVIPRDISSPKTSLKSASDEVDLQLENDRQYADLGIQIGQGPGSGKLSHSIPNSKPYAYQDPK